MSSRLYSVVFSAVTVTAAQDLFMVLPSVSRTVKLHGLMLGTLAAVNANLQWNVKFGATTVGSGGTAATANPLDSSDVAAAFTARVNDTTIASAGTIVTLHNSCFNENAGYDFWWTPETRPTAKGTSASNTRLVVGLVTAPASLVMSGTLYVEEIG